MGDGWVNDVAVSATIGELVKRYREQNHVSQAQFARDVGVSLRAVSAWENAERPAAVRSKAVHEALERVLGLHLTPLGGGRYRASPGDVVAALDGVDVVTTSGDEGRVVLSFPRGVLEQLTPVERELALARARAAALEAIREFDQSRVARGSDDAHRGDGS